MSTAIINIESELASYEARESVFEKISREMRKITKKEVYKDFSFPHCGGVFGILRHILQNPKKEQALLLKTGIRKAEIEYFRDNCGNTAYLKEGEIVKTREMDVERTRALVKLIAKRLSIELTDDEIVSEISEENWREISKLAERRARKAKRLSQGISKDIVIEE